MNILKYLIIVIAILLSACGNYKRFTYLQTIPPNKPDTLYNNSILVYKVQPADLLYVRITSLDENITKLFSSETVTNNSSMMGASGGGMYLTGYSIDKDGNITLPILGKIYVAGSTMDEVKQNVQKLATSYVKDAKVDVKLVSFKVAMLGEVNHPGQITIYNDKANIFEAIAQAGDISYNGNRRKITIVRNYNNTSRTIRVDLTKRDILGSQQYFLQPNDIVYVEPLKSTAFRLRVSDYSVFLTLITSTITAVLLITNATKK